MRETPFTKIRNLLVDQVPHELLCLLPEKWEKIGDVVIVKLPDLLQRYQQIIGRTYADILGCKTVLNDIGGISGVYREPHVTVIYGSPETETLHIENHVRFKLDPQKIMFSSGNKEERRRMATISNRKETVVDLFAGIGYFTIPMAVYSKPKKIVACEINPAAYEYLKKNIVLNHVTSVVEPLFGDNRVTAPKNCADRVVLGYLEEPHRFLEIAVECLKNYQGIVHYHTICPIEVVPEQPLKQVKNVAKKYKQSVTLIGWKEIKSYAPGIDHVVLDVRLGDQ